MYHYIVQYAGYHGILTEVLLITKYKYLGLQNKTKPCTNYHDFLITIVHVLLPYIRGCIIKPELPSCVEKHA